MTLDLEPIKARTIAATPGVWDYVAQGVIGLANQTSEDAFDYPLVTVNTDADGEFIAHAHADIPTLIAEIERLRAGRAS